MGFGDRDIDSDSDTGLYTGEGRGSVKGGAGRRDTVLYIFMGKMGKKNEGGGGGGHPVMSYIFHDSNS